MYATKLDNEESLEIVETDLSIELYRKYLVEYELKNLNCQPYTCRKKDQSMVLPNLQKVLCAEANE